MGLIYKGVDLYPWLGGMIGAKIFSAMDQSNQEGGGVEGVCKLHPTQARSQDFILGSGSEHAKRGP